MKKKVLSCLMIAILTFSFSLIAEASYITDPATVISYSGNTVTLSKDLYGFPNYGVVDNKSDVLYTGESGSWTFSIASLGINLSLYDQAKVTLSLVLDDHYSVASSNYSMNIGFLGVNQFSGATDLLGLVHGAPYGTKFTNWTSASFNSSLLSDPFIINLQNTSTNIAASDWIAIDTIKLELTSVPEPATMLLLGLGLVGLAGVRKKMK
jgi:hypothetical protein